MITCKGCGGIVGRDCFSPQKCELKSLDQQRRATKNGADARITDLETALRAAQVTIGGLMMEVAGEQAERGIALEEAAVISENIRFAFPASPTERAFNTGIESAVRCMRAAITAPRSTATKAGSPS